MFPELLTGDRGNAAPAGALQFVLTAPPSRGSQGQTGAGRTRQSLGGWAANRLSGGSQGRGPEGGRAEGTRLETALVAGRPRRGARALEELRGERGPGVSQWQQLLDGRRGLLCWMSKESFGFGLVSRCRNFLQTPRGQGLEWDWVRQASGRGLIQGDAGCPSGPRGPWEPGQPPTWAGGTPPAIYRERCGSPQVQRGAEGLLGGRVLVCVPGALVPSGAGLRTQGAQWPQGPQWHSGSTWTAQWPPWIRPGWGWGEQQRGGRGPCVVGWEPPSAEERRARLGVQLRLSEPPPPRR